MMLFRTVLISLVLGTTLVLSWLSDVDLTTASSLVLFLLIGTTYLLTLIYSLLLRRGFDPTALAKYQLAGDLIITTILVHVTGGAQSAYTFFYPLSIIAGAILFFRTGAITLAGASLVLLLAIALAGWSGLLPLPEGSRILPADQSTVELARSIGLNIAAILGLSLLASNLGAQLQRTSAHLATERSAAADLLTLHEDIIRSLPSGLVTVDERGHILSANRAARELLGSPNRLEGAHIDTIFPNLDGLVGSDAQVHGVELERTEDGRQQILGVSLAPLFDHRDRAIGQVVNFEDLTDLRRMQASVQRAERLAAVGQLAAGVAHEIRNPLASISGSIELLKVSPEGDDSKTLMDIVLREIDRLNGLIGELLEYANPREAQPQAIDLVSVCSETVRVFRQDRSFERVEVAFESRSAGEDDSVVVLCDPEKLRQVVWNLIRNAAEAAAGEDAEVRIEVSAGARAELRIHDNGPGIPPEHLDQIFDPFFTTKSRGSGLGLATVNSIVDEMGGSIDVESEENGGTCFTVHIPLADDGAQTGSTAPERGGARPSSDSAR